MMVHPGAACATMVTAPDARRTRQRHVTELRTARFGVNDSREGSSTRVVDCAFASISAITGARLRLTARRLLDNPGKTRNL